MYKIVKESKAVWDDSKEKIFNQVDSGTFNIWNPKKGDILNGEWWYAINTDNKICGYGWIDETIDGNFEFSLIVDKGCQKEGIGELLLKSLEQIGMDRGASKVSGIIQPENPNGAEMIEWLYKRGYTLIFNNQQRSKDFAINIFLKRVISLEMVKEIA